MNPSTLSSCKPRERPKACAATLRRLYLPRLALLGLGLLNLYAAPRTAAHAGENGDWRIDVGFQPRNAIERGHEHRRQIGRWAVDHALEPKHAH